VTLDRTGHDSLIGQTLGHYRIIDKIGSGGMGVVYSARDEHLDREVAIKVLPEQTILDEHARKLLHKEAVALSKLSHPNIATIHDFDTQQGLDFLVMEYVSGESLSRRSVGSALSEKEVASLGLQIAQALEEAHEHGIIHRDLKPANIAINSKGQVKVLDFGLAKFFDPAHGGLKAETLTQSVDDSHLMGTLPYMAPEQVSGEHIDARTDIYGLGVVLYEMATQKRPFRDESTPRLFDSILHQAVVAPRALNPHISPELERIILKCLEKEAENRYQSAKELAVDLRRLTMPSVVVTSVAVPGAKRSWMRKAAVPAVIAGLVAIVVVGALLLRSHSVHALTPQDTIVLADFDNRTGDPVFDDTLKRALAVHLEQSPFLNVLSDEKVNATLGLMGRQPGERLTPAVARDLCQRAGSKAMLAGSIATLGHEYIVGLRAIDCSTGDSLAQEQTEAASKEQVLKALGGAATALRRKLGESLASVQKYDTPLEQATTSSLEALKAYSAGWRTFQTDGDFAAIPFYKRAIELDPNFALAYSQLAIPYSNTGQATRASEAAKKAFELRDRVTEHEKYRLSAYYYLLTTGELQKAKEVYEMWKQTYPRDLIPYIDLSAIYMAFGQWERALPDAEQAKRMEPKDAFSWVNLVFIYFALNRLEDAKAALDQADAQKLDVYFLHVARYYAAFLSDDQRAMKEQVAWGQGRTEEHWVLAVQSDTEAYLGRRSNARELSRRAIDSARAADADETAALWQANVALREAEFDKASPVLQQTQAALGIAPGTYVRAWSALALARGGHAAEARQLAEALNRDFPEHALLRGYWLPAIWAAIELTRNNGEKAVELLQPATVYEIGQPPGSLFGMMYPVYLRGHAYLQMQKGQEAAAEFEKIIEHRGIVLNFPTGALAHLGLARAYVLQDDKTKARAAYKDFLTLWKDADPDISILKQAKAEYAKLQ